MTSRSSRAIPKGRPMAGEPHDRGYFAQRQWQPVREGVMVFVHVREHTHRRAMLHAADFARLTCRDLAGPFLDRWGWWIDEDGLMRAPSRHDRDTSTGVLVAAAILQAHEGDTLELAGDPFDLRLSGMRKLEESAHG